MDLILIRHPSVATAPGLCYGHLDVPLAEGWEVLLDFVREQLPLNFEQVHSSPSERCLAPARRWAGDAVEVREELREMDFGRWEGQLWDEIPRKELDPWMNDFTRHRVPGGESLLGLRYRAAAWREEIRERGGEATLAFTHSGVIRCLVGEAIGLSASRWFRLEVRNMMPVHIKLGKNKSMDSLVFG